MNALHYDATAIASFEEPGTAPEVTDEHVETAKSEILDNDETLLDDFADWEKQVFEAGTGQYTRMVKLVRDENSTGFANWREQHHAKQIDERAAELADLQAERAIEAAFND